MKILSLAIALAVVECLTHSAIAQTAKTPSPGPATAGAPAASSSEHRAQSTDPQLDEKSTEPPAAVPPETEAQRAARVKKIKRLQAQVDDCNLDFMGLPKEHEECIQKVRDQLTGEKSGNDTGPGEES